MASGGNGMDGKAEGLDFLSLSLDWRDVSVKGERYPPRLAIYGNPE